MNLKDLSLKYDYMKVFSSDNVKPLLLWFYSMAISLQSVVGYIQVISGLVALSTALVILVREIKRKDY